MSQIFINYRRDDSEAYADRLYDWLAEHFGHDHIFMDIHHIEPGEDFNEVIQKSLNSVQIAIVLIGKHWLDMTDTTGKRRLDDPNDLVRLEIAAVLERKIRTIPVLVGGGILPNSSQLPNQISSLVRFNAFEISSSRFHYDVDMLIKSLEKVLYGDGRGVISNKNNVVESFQKGIDVKADNDSVWLNMGLNYNQQGNHEKAIECYQKVIDINPNNDSALGNMGWIFLKLGMLEDALNVLKKAWEYSNHKMKEAPLNLGHVFLLQKNLKNAMEWYQTSLVLWKDREAFYQAMRSDFSDLTPEKHGISQQDFDAILEALNKHNG